MPILVDADPVVMYEIEPAPEPPRRVERRSRFRINPLLYVVGLVIILPLLILAGTLAVHRMRIEPRDGFALVTAELREFELLPGVVEAIKSMTTVKTFSLPW